jgi:hypothetical protein
MRTTKTRATKSNSKKGFSSATSAQMHAVAQAEKILLAYEAEGVPRRAAAKAGIRNLKARGLDRLRYGRHAIKWLEKQANAAPTARADG